MYLQFITTIDEVFNDSDTYFQSRENWKGDLGGGVRMGGNGITDSRCALD